MPNSGIIQDLDDWLLKLDNLQRALKSCSTNQPRRLQLPLASTREKQGDLYYRPLRTDQTFEAVQATQLQSPPSTSPQRQNPPPSVRRVFSSADPQQREFDPSSPVHHYFPGEQFPTPNRSDGEYLAEQNGVQPLSQPQHQPKSKTVRWSSEPAPHRPNGMQRLVSNLDSVEADLVNAASGCSLNRSQRGLNPLDIPEIPPHPAFTDGNNHGGDCSPHSQTIPDQIPRVPKRQQFSSPIMRYSPDPPIQNGTPPAERSSLQTQENYNTFTREKLPQAHNWVGNLNFWRSLQNRDGIDSLSLRNQREKEDDKKVILRVHQPNRTTKAIYVQSRTDAGEVVLMLAAKNFLPLSTKMALVEKVPSMKLERCFEDDEPVRDCILSWPVNSENLIFFEERQDLFGLFEDPQTWLGNTLVGESAQTKNSLLIDILEKDGANRLPPFKDYLYILQPNNKWKRRYCVLRSSGLYASKKQGSDISELVRVTAFGEHLHLYTTSGGWRKANAPTPYGFVLKPHSVVTMDPHMVRAFCAANEESLRIWCSLLRIILMGPRLLQNYRQRLAACALNYQVPSDCAAGDEEGLAALEGTSAEASVNHLAGLVRHKYARESNVYSGAGVRESARQYAKLPAIARARSVSQIQAQIATHQGSLRCSQFSLGPADRLGASVGDLGFVSGRTDVGRTSSMNELCVDECRATTSSTQSLNASQRLTCLFNPLRWSRRNVNEATTPQPMRRSTARKGPAARKCNRSSSSLHRPPSISPSSSVFFLQNAEDSSARVSAAVEEEQLNSMNQRQQQLEVQQSQPQQLPTLTYPSQRRQTTAPQTPHLPRHFAGIRPQLLPSQLSPAAL
ncbi:growth factor receptor bound protein [Echinococcus multilocularis]|uniref:Growth factor receptor bound protein n=1 Tax=Echinococcus multilocularis TaxID=6211 RepID=A0A068YJN4_ECHMU|nr:growth factor receptor bound protein [Echinococcus multilocularis]